MEIKFLSKLLTTQIKEIILQFVQKLNDGR